MPDELPWWKVALAPQDNPLVYQVRGVLKSLIFPNGFPTGRVLVGEGVLTKACRKKPKPRYCILYRTVSCICVSKALNVPQTGNSSSSMICLSMETLWSTRKSTTNRWKYSTFWTQIYPPLCSTWFHWRKLNWNPWRTRASSRMAGFYVPGRLQTLCVREHCWYRIFVFGWSCLDPEHWICRGKSFAVFAATATEKQEWMAHINKCIEVIFCSIAPHHSVASV